VEQKWLIGGQPTSKFTSGIANVAWKPVVEAGFMAGHLSRPVGRHGILSGVPATSIYGCALLALAIGVLRACVNARKVSPIVSLACPTVIDMQPEPTQTD